MVHGDICVDKVNKKEKLSRSCAIIRLSAALRLWLVCWNPIIVNCSSPPPPTSTNASLVEMMELITLEASSFKQTHMRALGSLILYFP
jgi:hypothetical protein